MKPLIKFKTLHCIALIVWLALSANGQAPPGALWYNGDLNGSYDPWWWNEIADPGPGGPDSCFGPGGALPIAQIYGDFTVPWPFQWTVTEVFSDNLNGYCADDGGQGVITGALWEIRQGVSAGNPGVLIASGFTVTPVVTATGRGPQYFRFTEYRVEVQGLNVFLPPGTYHLNVTPINGTRYSTTSSSPTFGTNCVGTPCGNSYNSFWNAANFAYWSPINDPDGNFAMGVVGSVTNVTLQLAGAASLKQGFSIPLPVSAQSGIEDRSGQPGGAYTITMTFDQNIASVGRASASCGKVTSTSIDGATLTINLTKVSCNASHITVTANDVKDSAGINLDGACLEVGLLLGDVNGDGVVDSADLDIVRSQLGQPTNGENFRSDINNDGTISSADVRIVTQQQGTYLP